MTTNATKGQDKPKFTPGPWRIGYHHKRTKLRDNLAFVNGGKFTIAKCDGDDARANAQLISCAPELYEALKLAQIWLANSMPVCELEGPKPLPVIADILAKSTRQ